MYLYIEIRPETLESISVLNEGVTPEIEAKQTFFAYSLDPEKHNKIITRREYEELWYKSDLHYPVAGSMF